MTTENAIAKWYRNACTEDARLLADVDARDLVDLAEGRLAGERRQRLVEAIATSPSLAQAYRLAKAGGDWARNLAADLAGERLPAARVAVLRPATRSVARRPFAIAAAVATMAIGAVFVSQRLSAPVDSLEGGYAGENPALHADAILATAFDGAGSAGGDAIFNASLAGEDQIFGQGFGKGS